MQHPRLPRQDALKLLDAGVSRNDEFKARFQRHLVEHSATVGTIDERYHGHLTSALELEALTVGDMARPNSRLSGVEPDASCAVIQQTARDTGHLRLLVRSSTKVNGVVHVRDSLRAPSAATASDLMRPALTLDVGEPVYAALRLMRENRSHLAVVTNDDEVVGLITLDDVLRRLLPGEDVTPDSPA